MSIGTKMLQSPLLLGTFQLQTEEHTVGMLVRCSSQFKKVRNIAVRVMLKFEKKLFAHDLSILK